MTFRRDGGIVVITDVPAQVCENCGEPFVDGDDASAALDVAAEARRTRASVLIQGFPLDRTT